MDKKNKDTIPPRMEINKKNIPMELKESPFWGLWQWRFVRELWTKVPVAPNGSSIDSKSFCFSFKKAMAYYRDLKHVSGIGFFFSKDHDIIGIDFDDCVVDGKIDKAIKKKIEKFGSYWEYSVSGSGIHIIGKGAKLLNGVDRKFVYAGSRYFTFTGNGRGKLKNIAKKTNKYFGKEKLIEQPTTGEKHSDISIKDLYKIVMNIRPDLPEPDWFLVCKAIHFKTEGSEKGWNLFNSWSAGEYCEEDQQYEKYNQEDCVKKWNRCKTKENMVGLPTLRRIESYYPVSKKAENQEIFKNELITKKYNSNELNEDLLPKKLRQAAREIARFNKVPIDPVITTMLMIFSAAINKNVIIQERGGREHNCSMGCIIGMSTGARKSAIDEDLMKPYFEHERDLIRSWEQEKHRNQVAIKLLKRKLKEVENADELKDDDKLEIMTNIEKQIDKKNCARPKLIESDVTEERLSDTLSKNNETIFIQSDDARNTITNITGRYDATSENIYISGITGSPYRRSRIKDDVEIVLFKPCINMCLKVQLDKLQSLVTKNLFKESGLIARLFLKIVEVDICEQVKENKDDVDLDISKMRHYYYALKKVLSYQGKPILVCLSKEAKEERLKFTHEYAALLESDWNDNYDVSNKIVTLSVKMATVISIMKNPKILEDMSKEFSNCCIEISSSEYKIAKKIVKILMSQTLEVLGKLERNTLIEGTKMCLEKIKEYVKNSGNEQFTMTDIKSKYDNNKRPIVDQYINILEEEKIITKNGKYYELN